MGAGGDRGRYVAERDTSYRVAKAIKKELGPNDRLLSVGEVRAYYFTVPFTIEGELQRFTGYGNKLASVEAVRSFLKEKGFTHVLYLDRGPLPNAVGSLRVPEILCREQPERIFLAEKTIMRVGNARYVLYQIT